MADTYAPVYEANGTILKVTTAYTINGLLDRWYTQPHIPVARTRMGEWLMDQAGYTPPVPTPPGPPTPTTGQLWPR